MPTKSLTGHGSAVEAAMEEGGDVLVEGNRIILVNVGKHDEVY